MDDAEQIMAEGLRPNQPTNFADNLKWNIEGNVFLTEKQGVQTWQEHIGEMAESKLESQSRTLAWELNAAQASLSDLVERGPHKDYDAERVGIQKEINKLTKQKEAINGRVQEHERDTTGHTKVFRVPKSKVQDYIAIDEAGTRDAQADAFKLNNYVTDRVKWAKQQTGIAEQQASHSLKEVNRFAKDRKAMHRQGVIHEMSYESARDDAARILKEHLATSWDSAPKNTGYRYKSFASDDGERSILAIYDRHSIYKKIGREWRPIFSQPVNEADKEAYGTDIQQQRRSPLLDKFKQVLYEGRSSTGERIKVGEQPYGGEYHFFWNEENPHVQQVGRPGTINPEIELDHFLSNPRARKMEDTEAWQQYQGSTEYLQLKILDKLITRAKALEPGSFEDELARSNDWYTFGSAEEARTSLEKAWSDEIGTDEHDWLPKFQPLINSLERIGESSQELSGAKTRIESWESGIQEELDQHLTTLAKGQLRNLQLKVASSPNYWRWAKDNHAVDDEGLPLIIFHGTKRGGFDKFGNLDVEGHIYGSTDVATGSTYSGGFTDDVTPVFATDLSDIEHTLNTTEKYSLEVGDDGYKVIQISRRDGGPIGEPIIEAATEEEFIVAWNRWIAEGKDVLNARGVYPLIYRLTNPLVVEGNGSNWNSIPLFAEHDGTPESLLADPMFQARMKTETKTTPLGQMYGNAKRQMEGSKFTADNLTDDYENSGQPDHVFANTRWAEGVAKAKQRAVDYQRAFESLKQYSHAFLIEPDNQNLHDHDVLAEASRIYSDALGEDFVLTSGTPGRNAGPDFLLLDTFSVGVHDTGTTRELSEIAEAAGHDGIIFKDIIDDGGQGGTDQPYGGLDPADVYVSFTTAQVKSAHNGGNFAEMSPDRNKLMYSATA